MNSNVESIIQKELEFKRNMVSGLRSSIFLNRGTIKYLKFFKYLHLVPELTLTSISIFL